jgi:hypothetical protein
LFIRLCLESNPEKKYTYAVILTEAVGMLHAGGVLR